MKYAESHAAKKTISEDAQKSRGPTRFSPASMMPRKDDSRKNAKTPSRARVCPITPPANWEKFAQFVPNWNSIGTPVATPKAKVMAKIAVQKCAARCVVLIATPVAERAEQDDQERQAHRQLREQVVKGDGGGELEPVNGQGRVIASTHDSGRVRPRSSSDLQVLSRSS